MKRVFTILSILFVIIPVAGATHNRAGEITLTQTGPNTYEILIQTFTYQRSAADRPQLEVQWGDGTTSIADRYSKTTLPNFYFHNKYSAVHTYPGPGTYTIVVQDPNRNYGVVNIPNSVNVIFSIKTTIAINPDIGENTTPVLLNPPIDRAAVGQIFIHNPSAYDHDGDSISYKLTVCTEENGEPIEGYTLPEASDSLYVNEVSGDLVWDTPVDTGIYNIAIAIEEWRKGVKIGSISRDMQIDVYNTDNQPPVNMPLRDFCVEAGDLIEYDILSTDPDSDRVTLTASGGPFLFQDSPATFDTLLTGRGYSVSRFSWQTNCSHVRYQPYNVVIKAEDDNTDLKLVDINNFSIKVIGPAPENLRTQAGSSSIQLSWDTCDCENVTGYEIYRKEGSSTSQPDSCENGVPGYLGYERIGVNDGRTQILFTDDNGGEGLQQGIEYCYMVVALYGDDDVPGYPSAEACDVLIPGTPSMLQASVINVAPAGEILLSWARPRGLDTIPANGPYEYILYRSDLDPRGDNLQQIYSFTTSDLNDTSYIDTPLNTVSYPYSYTVELYNDEPGNRFLIGRREVVSTTWLQVDGADNANIISVHKNTPWVNDRYVIYRQNPSGTYDSIGTSTTSEYMDSGLQNGQEYCYQVKTTGWREVDGIIYTSENLTHTACGTPLDTVPPCPPDLTVESFCDSSYNLLVWTNPNNSCADDVVAYNIYYSTLIDGNLVLIDSTLSATDTIYQHFLSGSLAACYAVTAIDSFGNESAFSTVICVDNCIDYTLPNVFTPNGDGLNDYFRPNAYSFVESVDMKIYNRWGNLVFQTTDPDINWDGKQLNTDRLVSPGVYYYICDVYEQRITGLEVRNIVGFVHVFMESDAVNPPIE